MRIYPLSDLTYRLTMGDFRSAQTDGCLDIAGCKISGCFSEEGTPQGFAIYRVGEHENKKFASLFALACAQNGDVQKALLSDLVEKCKEEGAEKLYWNTDVATAPEGFTCEKVTRVYRAERDLTEQWRAFRQSLASLCRREIARGYVSLPLCDCTEAQKKEIQMAYRDFRDSGYMDGVFQGGQGKVCSELCRVVLKDDHVVAYCILTEEPENPKDCRLVYLGTTKETRRTPVGIFALCKTIDAFVPTDYRCIRFVINEKNIDSGSLMAKQLSFVKPRTTIYEYIYHLKNENKI